jgi:hypothetical protein
MGAAPAAPGPPPVRLQQERGGDGPVVADGQLSAAIRQLVQPVARQPQDAVAPRRRAPLLLLHAGRPRPLAAAAARRRVAVREARGARLAGPATRQAGGYRLPAVQLAADVVFVGRGKGDGALAPALRRGESVERSLLQGGLGRGPAWQAQTCCCCGTRNPDGPPRAHLEGPPRRHLPAQLVARQQALEAARRDQAARLLVRGGGNSWGWGRGVGGWAV